MSCLVRARFRQLLSNPIENISLLLFIDGRKYLLSKLCLVVQIFNDLKSVNYHHDETMDKFR